MFSNLTLIAVLVFVLWIVTVSAYFYATRQQSDLQTDIDALRDALAADEKDDEYG